MPEHTLIPLRRSEPAGYMTQHAPACSSTVLSRTITTCMLQPQAACSLALRAQTEPISCHHCTAAVAELAEPQPWPGVSPGIAAEGARPPLTCRQCNGAISPDLHKRQPGPPPAPSQNSPTPVQAWSWAEQTGAQRQRSWSKESTCWWPPLGACWTTCKTLRWVTSCLVSSLLAAGVLFIRLVLHVVGHSKASAVCLTPFLQLAPSNCKTFLRDISALCCRASCCMFVRGDLGGVL